MATPPAAGRTTPLPNPYARRNTGDATTIEVPEHLLEDGNEEETGVKPTASETQIAALSIVPPKPSPKNENKPCFLCKKKLRVVYLITTVFAAVAYVLYQMQLDEEGVPITENSSFASGRFKLMCIMVGILGLAGFVILSCGVSSMAIGIIYMFVITAALYYCAITISTAKYSNDHDNFDDTVAHLKAVFARTGDILPLLARHQQKEKCCGWGIVYTRSWANVLGNNDLPDSCCIEVTVGCGKGLVPITYSGVVYTFETEFYNQVISKKPGIDENCARNILGVEAYNTLKAKNYAGVPDFILRQIDEYFYRKNVNSNSHFGPFLCPFWKYNIEDVSILIYESRGLEELRRLDGVIFNKSCGARAEDDSDPTYFLGSTHGQMEFVIIFAGVLCCLCILMAVLFWYYFSRIQAQVLAELKPPRDFQELDIESSAFEGGITQEDDARAYERYMVAERARKAKLLLLRNQALVAAALKANRVKKAPKVAPKPKAASPTKKSHKSSKAGRRHSSKGRRHSKKSPKREKRKSSKKRK